MARLIDADNYCSTICKCNRRECDKGKCPIHTAPTAYDTDKVVKQICDMHLPLASTTTRIVNIVKAGGIDNK